jgi:hypothetical protein
MRPNTETMQFFRYYCSWLRKEDIYMELQQLVYCGIQWAYLFSVTYVANQNANDGEFGGMKIGRGNRSTRRKPAPAPLCPPQIPFGQTRDRTRAAAEGSQRLTAWAMARPTSTFTGFVVLERFSDRNFAGSQAKLNIFMVLLLPPAHCFADRFQLIIYHPIIQRYTVQLLAASWSEPQKNLLPLNISYSIGRTPKRKNCELSLILTGLETGSSWKWKLIWRVLHSGSLYRVVCSKSTDVSDKHVVSIFRIEK